MTRAACLFALTSLVPVPLLVLAALSGGPWVWAAVLYLTLFAFAMDEVVAAGAGPQDEPGREFPLANVLSVALALAHFPLLALVVRALASGGHGPAGTLGLFLAAGLFIGQIGNANAHDLIHRPRRGLHVLGKWVYISLLFGHHCSAHRLVHHRHVATPDDPNTARPGEGYYRFLPRAWAGSFRAGLRAESARLAGRRRRTRWARHPYLVYLLGAWAWLALAAVLAGPAGVVAWAALALFAQSQLLLSDYVQHYGLQRARLPGGRPEPVATAHSWDAPHWFTGHMMLNAPRHADHHAHPDRPFAALALPAGAPTLPYSLPAMGLLALWPPAWRRVMDARAAAWRAAPAGQTERRDAA